MQIIPSRSLQNACLWHTLLCMCKYLAKMLRDRSVGRTRLPLAPWRSRPLAGPHLTTMHRMQSCPNWCGIQRTAACTRTLLPPSSAQLAHTPARRTLPTPRHTTPRQRNMHRRRGRLYHRCPPCCHHHLCTPPSYQLSAGTPQPPGRRGSCSRRAAPRLGRGWPRGEARVRVRAAAEHTQGPEMPRTMGRLQGTRSRA